MIIALVTLLVVTLMAATLLKSLLLLHRQSRRSEQQLQAVWLAEAALDRAAAMIASDEKFTRETWSVDLQINAPASRGIAEIKIETLTDQPRERRITIVARYPDDPVQRAQVERTLVITLPAKATEPGTEP